MIKKKKVEEELSSVSDDEEEKVSSNRSGYLKDVTEEGSYSNFKSKF